MMKDRPRCPCCDKPLPKLTKTVWVHNAKESAHRQRNTDWSRYIYLDEPLRSIADCRKHTNQQVVSVSYNTEYISRLKGTVSWFTEWDGETYWTKSMPFCKPDCALAFARAAHRAGYRLVKKEAA